MSRLLSRFRGGSQALLLLRSSFSSASAPLRDPDASLLRLLACPLTRQPLVYVPRSREVVSLAARVAFPVLADGTVDLNVFDGRVLEEAEIAELTPTSQPQK